MHAQVNTSIPLSLPLPLLACLLPCLLLPHLSLPISVFISQNGLQNLSHDQTLVMLTHAEIGETPLTRYCATYAGVILH